MLITPKAHLLPQYNLTLAPFGANANRQAPNAM